MRGGILRHAVAIGITLLGCSSAWAQVQVTAPGVSIGIGRTPWFQNAAIRRELRLQDAQYNRLARDYNLAWEAYNKNVSELNKDLAEEQRRQRMQEYSGSFYGTFNKSVDEAFTDANARRRYNQLYWQYRGYGAFEDPVVAKKLALTAEQRKTLRGYEDEYNRELRELRREYATDREAATRRYDEWRVQTRDRINATLTAQQRQAWNDFIGDPYDFPVSVYVEE